MTDTKTETQWPALDWLPGYRKEWLTADAVAGVTSAAVVVPKALAFATITVGRAFRERGEEQPEADRELVALGVANVAGGFVGGMPAVVLGTLKGILVAVLLCLASLNHHVREIVGRSSLGATLGRERMFFNLQQALENVPALLDRGGSAAPPTPA